MSNTMNVSYMTRVYNNFLKNCEEKSSQKQATAAYEVNIATESVVANSFCRIKKDNKTVQFRRNENGFWNNK